MQYIHKKLGDVLFLICINKFSRYFGVIFPLTKWHVTFYGQKFVGRPSSIKVPSVSLSLHIYSYVYIYMCVCVWIYCKLYYFYFRHQVYTIISIRWDPQWVMSTILSQKKLMMTLTGIIYLNEHWSVILHISIIGIKHCLYFSIYVHLKTILFYTTICCIIFICERKYYICS